MVLPEGKGYKLRGKRISSELLAGFGPQLTEQENIIRNGTVHMSDEISIAKKMMLAKRK